MCGANLAIDISEVGSETSLTKIAGITTFDMSILGSIIIALLTSYIHDKLFDYELPEFLGTFNGSVLVYVAPVLFVIRSILAGLLAMVLFLFGVLGDFGSGIINFMTLNLLSLTECMD